MSLFVAIWFEVLGIPCWQTQSNEGEQPVTNNALDQLMKRILLLIVTSARIQRMTRSQRSTQRGPRSRPRMMSHRRKLPEKTRGELNTDCRPSHKIAQGIPSLIVLEECIGFTSPWVQRFGLDMDQNVKDTLPGPLRATASQNCSYSREKTKNLRK